MTPMAARKIIAEGIYVPRTGRVTFLRRGMILPAEIAARYRMSRGKGGRMTKSWENVIYCYCTDCQRVFRGHAAALGEEAGFVLVEISAMCPYCGEFVVSWEGKIPIVSDLSVMFGQEGGKGEQ